MAMQAIDNRQTVGSTPTLPTIDSARSYGEMESHLIVDQEFSGQYRVGAPDCVRRPMARACDCGSQNVSSNLTGHPKFVVHMSAGVANSDTYLGYVDSNDVLAVLGSRSISRTTAFDAVNESAILSSPSNYLLK